MTAITADDFLRTPLLERVAEALSAIAAQHGRARAVAWARSSDEHAVAVLRDCAAGGYDRYESVAGGAAVSYWG